MPDPRRMADPSATAPPTPAPNRAGDAAGGNPQPPRPRSGASALALRAAVPAIGLAFVLAFVATNLFVLPADAPRFVWYGAGLAVLTGLVALRLQAGAVLVPVDRPLASQKLMIALGAGFLLQLVGVAGGILVLHRMDVKFPCIVALGLAFAGTALVFQVVGGVAIGRVLRGPGARASADAGPATT